MDLHRPFLETNTVQVGHTQTARPPGSATERTYSNQNLKRIQTLSRIEAQSSVKRKGFFGRVRALFCCFRARPQHDPHPNQRHPVDLRFAKPIAHGQSAPNPPPAQPAKAVLSEKTPQQRLDALSQRLNRLENSNSTIDFKMAPDNKPTIKTSQAIKAKIADIEQRTQNVASDTDQRTIDSLATLLKNGVQDLESLYAEFNRLSKPGNIAKLQQLGAKVARRKAALAAESAQYIPNHRTLLRSNAMRSEAQYNLRILNQANEAFDALGENIKTRIQERKNAINQANQSLRDLKSLF